MLFTHTFAQRSSKSELIDELTLSGEDLRRNLEELAFINRWLGGNQVTISGLNKLMARHHTRLSGKVAGQKVSEQLHIADLGCGGGDMLALMAQWADKQSEPIHFTGIDANAFILAYARRNTANFNNITYLQQNIFSDEFRQQTFDVVTGTLLCHHFDSASLTDFLRQLRKQVKLGIVINDIHRHWLAYYSIAWLTRWFSRSYLVKHDAKLSVWRAFRRHELEAIITAAGFTDFQIRWKWAFRWEVVIFV